MQVEIRYPTQSDSNGMPIVFRRTTNDFNSPVPARHWAAKVIAQKLQEFPMAAGNIKITAGTKTFDEPGQITW